MLRLPGGQVEALFDELPSGLIPLTCNELQHLFGPGRPARRRSRPPAALVGPATPAPGSRPSLPRPTTGRLATMKITTYGWSTNPNTSWWRRAFGPGPTNGGGIP
jgi:hypothetical protein